MVVTKVKEWVDLLEQHYIDTVFDRYDLHPGADKYAYMEKAVNDNDIDKVLIFSDKFYAKEQMIGKAGSVPKPYFNHIEPAG